MIRSMTGYGAETLEKSSKSLTIEIRTLNHRYCEINIRLPKKLFFLENTIKNQIKNHLLRGKIDVYITYQHADGADATIRYNRDLAQKYVSEIQKMSTELFLENDLSVSKILHLADLFLSDEENEPEDFLEGFMCEAVDAAVAKVIQTRETEGESLRCDILKKLDEIEQRSQKLPELEKESTEEYRLRLTEKVKEILHSEGIDENRIVTETAIMADRLSVDEEIVRLKSHITHMRNVLNEEIGIGKKLDFIVQEMNREVNTIASKSIHIEMKNIAIDLKNTIEKIREQIQNIE